jgi:hypothetical protein
MQEGQPVSLKWSQPAPGPQKNGAMAGRLHENFSRERNRGTRRVRSPESLSALCFSRILVLECRRCDG